LAVPANIPNSDNAILIRSVFICPPLILQASSIVKAADFH
jgi:hypothetical protein